MIAIIGGTGLYAVEELEDADHLTVDTPFGAPSAPIVRGRWGGQAVCFLPRHGLGHRLLPSEINFRANVFALKQLGVHRVISVSATGSLRQAIAPGHLVLPDQYFDWTKGRRAASFFGEGIVGHVSTARPVCADLVRRLQESVRSISATLHRGGTYACVEGPRFGTTAESHFLRSAGCAIVGMTNLPEAFLAREAQMCYATVAVATDYDSWKEDPAGHVSMEEVLAVYRKSLAEVTRILRTMVAEPGPAMECDCRQSLRHAVLTPEGDLSPAHRALLAVLRA